MKKNISLLMYLFALSACLPAPDSNAATPTPTVNPSKPVATPAQSVPRLVGGTWYYDQAPGTDRQPSNGQHANDVKARERYFAARLAKLKSRNPEADAMAAIKSGQKFFLGLYNPTNNFLTLDPYNMRRFNFFPTEESIKKCGGTNINPAKRLEGTWRLVQCDMSPSCFKFGDAAENYVYRFDKVMNQACSK
jgi:hypothetical protein